jgi:hypothetical protein
LCHVVVDGHTEDFEVVEDAEESLFARCHLQLYSRVDPVYLGASAIEIEQNVAC